MNDNSQLRNSIEHIEVIRPEDQALYAYTYGTAYAVGMEEKTGTLETGKYADIVVLDQNLLTIPEEEILNTKVVMTIMNGKTVYQKEEAK